MLSNKKIINIGYCYECPYVDIKKYKPLLFICKMCMNREIENSDTIPEWCPLEEYKEKDV